MRKKKFFDGLTWTTGLLLALGFGISVAALVLAFR
jgi:hypothetical protein